MDWTPTTVFETNAKTSWSITHIAPVVAALAASHVVATFGLEYLRSADSAPADRSAKLVANLSVKRRLTAETIAMPALTALEAHSLPTVRTRDLVREPGTALNAAIAPSARTKPCVEIYMLICELFELREELRVVLDTLLHNTHFDRLRALWTPKFAYLPDTNQLLVVIIDALTTEAVIALAKHVGLIVFWSFRRDFRFTTDVAQFRCRNILLIRQIYLFLCVLCSRFLLN